MASKYRYLGLPWSLDGKAVRYGDTLTLTDDVARSLMAQNHALEPVDDGGVQPFTTGGRSDMVAAGIAVDEFGEPLAPKPKK